MQDCTHDKSQCTEEPSALIGAVLITCKCGFMTSEGCTHPAECMSYPCDPDTLNEFYDYCCRCRMEMRYDNDDDD